MNGFTTVLSLFSFCLCSILPAQVVKDSSFTVRSEFNKQAKRFAHIKVAASAKSEAVSESYNTVYKNTGVRNLHLDAFLHKGSKKRPAVIIIHGGGWKSGSKEMHTPMARDIAASGYQTFTVEYRLSDEAPYPEAIEDVLDAIQFIKKNADRYTIDSTKIALVGASSGAQMASLIGTKYPGTAQAIVNLDGILSFHHPDSEEGKLAALWLGGSYAEKPEVWEDASALTHVSAKSAPTLFINSPYKRFSAGRDEMIDKMKSFGIYSEAVAIDNSPHTFWLFEPWYKTTIKYIHNFLHLTFTKP